MRQAVKVLHIGGKPRRSSRVMTTVQSSRRRSKPRLSQERIREKWAEKAKRVVGCNITMSWLTTLGFEKTSKALDPQATTG
jgi:hypothetical protein